MSTNPHPATLPRRWLSWAQVDVFADAPFQGNMLAIFPDATGLNDAHMQALARETNLSETTFVFPQDAATERHAGVRVRIFTTAEELPFAGHPTLGTASWLRLHRPEFADADEITLALNVGPVRVRFPRDAAGCPGGIVAEMLQPSPQFLGNVDRDAVARTLHLQPRQLHLQLAPQVVSTGLPVVVVPLASTGDLQSIQPDFAGIASLLRGTPAKFLYCIAQQDATTWRARLPFYAGEDPATGSAAGCAISYLVARGSAAPAAPLTILQGEFVNRPSRIVTRASCNPSGVFDVRVLGCTIPVAEGRFLHP